MIEQWPALLSGKGGMVLATLLVFMAAERAFPVARWVGGLTRVLRNLAVAGCNLFIGPLIVIPITLFAASHAPLWRPEIWSGWPGLLVDLLLLDLWIYWWHRANHVVPLLWRFHAVHHLDETLDATSALRFHFGEVALSAIARAVLVLVLAIPVSSVLAFEMLIVFVTMFHHSNLRLPQGVERALSLIIVTPSIHWVHHHAQRADTDSSYATVLSVWDRVFASRSSTVRDAAMPIGVEGMRDRPLLKLLAWPFFHS